MLPTTTTQSQSTIRLPIKSPTSCKFISWTSFLINPYKNLLFYFTWTQLFISILWSNNYLLLECSSFRWRLKRVIPTVQIASPDALVNGRSARVECRPNISWGGPKSDSEGCPEFKKEAEVINIEKETLYLSSLFKIACPTRTWHSDSPFYWDVALITPQVAFQSAFQT